MKLDFAQYIKVTFNGEKIEWQLQFTENVQKHGKISDIKGWLWLIGPYEK
jgi:hypothetical protein